MKLDRQLIVPHTLQNNNNPFVPEEGKNRHSISATHPVSLGSPITPTLASRKNVYVVPFPYFDIHNAAPLLLGRLSPQVLH